MTQRPARAARGGALLAAAAALGVVVSLVARSSFEQPALVALIAASLAVPIVRRAISGRVDPLEPIVCFVALWFLQFVARPVVMLVGGDQTLRGLFDVSAGMTRALVLGLIGSVVFIAAYERFTKKKPSGKILSNEGGGVPGLIFTSAVAVAALGVMFSQFGANQAAVSAESGAYIYLIPLASTSAILMLLIRSRAGYPFAAVAAAGVAALSVVYFLFFGQRAFVLLPLSSVAVFHLLMRGTRPNWPTLAIATFLVVLPFSSVIQTAREQQTSPIAALSASTLDPVTSATRFAEGDTTAMFPALALQMQTEGTNWTRQPGSELVSILTRPVPSSVWPDKPKSSSEELYSRYFPSLYRVTKAGTLFTMVSEFYYDSGIIGVVIGMAVVGVLFAWMWSFVGRQRGDPWVCALYAPVPLMASIAFRGDLALTFGLSLFIFGPLVIAFALSRLRATQHATVVYA